LQKQRTNTCNHRSGSDEESGIATSEQSTFLDNLTLYAPGRRLFSADLGHIGLGLSHIEPGDCVGVAIGSCDLMIFRPTLENHYRVIGPSNLHGFWDYEALLGPLPENWYVLEDAGTKRTSWDVRYVNANTGEKTKKDPRLPGEPPGWTWDEGTDGDGDA
jgi:hypothetical protein